MAGRFADRDQREVKRGLPDLLKWKLGPGPTIERLGDARQFIAPLGLGEWFSKRGKSRVVELDWWGAHDLGGARVTFVPARDWSRRGAFGYDDTLWGGFTIEGSDRRVYHS